MNSGMGRGGGKQREREREREREMIEGPSSLCIPEVLKLQTCEQPNDTFQIVMCKLAMSSQSVN